jgi:hypothetical protein
VRKSKSKWQNLLNSSQEAPSKWDYYSYAWYHHPTQWQGTTLKNRKPNSTARFPDPGALFSVKTHNNCEELGNVDRGRSGPSSSSISLPESALASALASGLAAMEVSVARGLTTGAALAGGARGILAAGLNWTSITVELSLDLKQWLRSPSQMVRRSVVPCVETPDMCYMSDSSINKCIEGKTWYQSIVGFRYQSTVRIAKQIIHARDIHEQIDSKWSFRYNFCSLLQWQGRMSKKKSLTLANFWCTKSTAPWLDKISLKQGEIRGMLYERIYRSIKNG